MMEDLKAMIAQIEQDEAIISEDLATVDRRYLLGRETAKAVAEQRLEKTKRRYSEAIVGNSIAVILAGAPASQQIFAEFAEDEAESVTVDAEELYVRLGKPILASVGKDQMWLTNQTFLMLQELADLEVEMGIARMPRVDAPPASYVKTEKEVAAVIRKQIRASVEDDLNRMYIHRRTAEKALEIRYNNNVVPVVLINASDIEVPNLKKVLFSGRNVIVTMPEGKIITKDFVKQTFGRAYKALLGQFGAKSSQTE